MFCLSYVVTASVLSGCTVLPPFYRLGKGCEFTGIHAVLAHLTFKLSTLSKPKYNVVVRNIVKQRDLKEQKCL